jgi:hypothetical protein
MNYETLSSSMSQDDCLICIQEPPDMNHDNHSLFYNSFRKVTTSTMDESYDPQYHPNEAHFSQGYDDEADDDSAMNLTEDHVMSYGAQEPRTTKRHDSSSITTTSSSHHRRILHQSNPQHDHHHSRTSLSNNNPFAILEAALVNSTTTHQHHRPITATTIITERTNDVQELLAPQPSSAISITMPSTSSDPNPPPIPPVPVHQHSMVDTRYGSFLFFPFMCCTGIRSYMYHND